MDYGNPKTVAKGVLPATGGALFTLHDQILILTISFLTTVLIASTIHYFWRRHKNIGQ